MERKENIKELFFNYSTKHWHFEEIVKESGLSRAQTNEWLQRLIKEKLIKRIKVKRKAPYYISNYTDTQFKMQKRISAWKKFEKTGFLEHLDSLPKAETVIIFGSFARADWYNDSDIDLFIYGNANDLDKAGFEKKLKREIHVFQYKDKTSLKHLEPAVIANILAGFNIKGSIKPFKVSINA